MAIDVSERPLFFLMRDGKPISYTFRLNDRGSEFTLMVKPHRGGLVYGGFLFTAMAILPVGIPMIVAGVSKVWLAPGPPATDQAFVKVKKAKV